jgi:hypothetical protein
MIGFHSRIWPAIQSIRARLKGVKKLDILTAYLGAGASKVLTDLGVKQGRIAFGLDLNDPFLAQSQIDELHRLKDLAALRVCPGLHAKLYLFDNAVMVLGSANFTRRGFERLLEANLVLDDVGAVKEARHFFDETWAKSTPIDKIINSIRASGEKANEGGRGIGVPPKRGKSPFGEVGLRPKSLPRVRIAAFKPSYVAELEERVKYGRTDWTSGRGIQKNDVQLFCFSKDLRDAEQLRDDPRIDAAHSLWRALGPIHPVPGNRRWPRQADFKLLVRLNKPVPIDDFVAGHLLEIPRRRQVPFWPQGSKGEDTSRRSGDYQACGGFVTAKSGAAAGDLRRIGSPILTVDHRAGTTIAV